MEATSLSSLARGELPTNVDGGSNQSSSSLLLDDVAIVDNSLRANGLARHDVTPKAYACLLEQARRFALELLTNAHDYAIHAERSNPRGEGNSVPLLLVHPSDILLAAEMLEDGAAGGGVHGVSSTLPDVEQISELAQTVNRVPLPPIPANCYDGVVLPPVEEQLTARTYDVVDGARVVQRMMRGGDAPMIVSDYYSGGLSSPPATNNAAEGAKKKTVPGSYGAVRGRQIAVCIKGKELGTDEARSTIGEERDASATTTAASSGSGKSTSTTKPIKKGLKRGLTEL